MAQQKRFELSSIGAVGGKIVSMFLGGASDLTETGFRLSTAVLLDGRGNSNTWHHTVTLRSECLWVQIHNIKLCDNNARHLAH
eukprot:5837451-Amphidinium_carterae.1